MELGLVKSKVSTHIEECLYSFVFQEVLEHSKAFTAGISREENREQNVSCLLPPNSFPKITFFGFVDNNVPTPIWSILKMYWNPGTHGYRETPEGREATAPLRGMAAGESLENLSINTECGFNFQSQVWLLASTFFWWVTLICKCSRMTSVKQIQQRICDEFEWRWCCNRLATLGFRVACFSSCLLPEVGLAVKHPIKVLLFPFRRNTLKLLWDEAKIWWMYFLCLSNWQYGVYLSLWGGACELVISQGTMVQI